MGKPTLEGELVLAVDFDGTITTQPDMGHELVLQPNCKEVLERLHEDGVKLILWTCRSGPALDEALDFLIENDNMHLLFSAINDQLPEIREKYEPHVGRKVGADFYIDDKNMFTKIDWMQIQDYIYGEERADKEAI